MTQIDWSKAPQGFPVWVESKVSNTPSDWHRLERNGFLVDRKGARWEPWQVQDGECIPHHKLEWDGNGLPPVGMACEAKVLDGCGQLVWREVKVIHHHPEHEGSAAVAHGGERLLSWADDFRPIRTAEQIAADERKAAIKQMQKDCACYANQDIFADLYDCGYRKQVAP